MSGMSGFAAKCAPQSGKQERPRGMRLAAVVNSSNGKVSSLVANPQLAAGCESRKDEAVKEMAAVAEGRQSRPETDGCNWDGDKVSMVVVVVGVERGECGERAWREEELELVGVVVGCFWLAGGVAFWRSLIEGRGLASACRAEL
jgi:hypothetical protein